MRGERLYPRQDLSHLANLEVKVPPGKRLLRSDLLQKFIIGLALAGAQGNRAMSNNPCKSTAYNYYIYCEVFVSD